jgi:hypothetical protein
MNPSTWLRSSPILMTAAAFASEHATYSRFPSGESPRAEGVMPSGCRGVIATLMLSTTFNSLPALTPTANTLFVLAAATKIRATYAGGWPSAVSGEPARQTMSLACAPTRTAVSSAPDAVS